ncbi:IS1 family transposase [Klebsiella pneumoniae]
MNTDYFQQCLSKTVELHDKDIGHYLNIKHNQ